MENWYKGEDFNTGGNRATAITALLSIRHVLLKV